MKCESVILAAGLGTRMRSETPKVVHRLGGQPMLWWAVEACREATGGPPYIVVGPDSRAIGEAVGGQVVLIEQAERLGTGHALLQAEGTLRGRSELVLAMSADMPLLRAETLRSLIEAQRANRGPITLLSVLSESSRGFGRVVRSEDGRVLAVVEEAVASPQQLALREMNASVYCFESAWLWDHLPKVPLSPNGEYYLTDLVGLAAGEGLEVIGIQVQDPEELIGINTREHLAEAEAVLRRRINSRWMLEGVSIPDPATAYIGPWVILGRDTLVLPNTHLEGRTVVGEGCVLGPNTIVRDSTVGSRCEIEASVIEGAVLEQGVEVGPFSHLRPGTHLGPGVHVGNFGEIKNSTLGAGAKMGHFSYVGDASIGEDVNIGAGTITCNFGRDGKKHRTEIGEGAFIGSDTLLVAPLRVGPGAVTGAGSVVTKDIPERSVAAGVPARVIRTLGKDE